MLNTLKKYREENKREFLFCMAVIFIIGLAAHGYRFSNFLLNHDSLDGLYLSGRENYHKAELGRFFVMFYRKIFRGSFTMPWTVGLLSLVWLSISLFLGVKILGIKSRFLTVLLGGVMVTDLSVTALTATFIHDLDSNMFAAMLCFLAVYLWKENISGWLILGAAAICVSLGIYQSYISVAIMLIVCVILVQLLNNTDLKTVVISSAKAMAMGAAGGIMYRICIKVLPVLLNTPLAERDNSITAIGKLSLAKMPGRIMATYSDWWEHIRNPHTAWLNGNVVFLLNMAVIVLTVAAVAYVALKKKISPVNMVLVGVILALSPFCMNLVRLMRSEYHDLMKFAFVFMFVIPLVIFRNFDVKLVDIAACFAVCLVIYSNVQTSNEVYLRKDMVYQATYSRMSFVAHDMTEFGYNPGEGEVFISNRIPVKGYSEFGEISKIHAVFMNNAVTEDYKSIDYYFDYVLGLPVNFCSKEKREEILATQEYDDMPVYPDRGYIAYIDDVLVVKLNH